MKKSRTPPDPGNWRNAFWRRFSYPSHPDLIETAAELCIGSCERSNTQLVIVASTFTNKGSSQESKSANLDSEPQLIVEYFQSPPAEGAQPADSKPPKKIVAFYFVVVQRNLIPRKMNQQYSFPKDHAQLHFCARQPI